MKPKTSIWGSDRKIEWTLKYYPEMAKQGWCFVVNRHYIEKENVSTILEITRKANGLKISYLKDLIAYDGWRKELSDYYPVFFKAEDPEELKKLGYIFPAKIKKVSIWELLDI